MLWTLIRRMLPQSQKEDFDDAGDLCVIGAGLPRTGTSSLKAALEILGFGPCHHMSELFAKPDRSIEFARALDGEKVDFRVLMKGYGSTVDSPTADLYKEIHQAFPKAKIILTVRDSGEKWYESIQNTFGSTINSDLHYFSMYLIRFLRLQCVVTRKLTRKWIREYGKIGPKMHDQHNKRVINENNEKDLLVFNVKEGWAPLCKFLEVDIPKNIPFPNVNDTQVVKRALKTMQILGWCSWILLTSIVSVGCYVLW
ncbi:hypothetical protein I4U23_005439 [Adineta vaga]|nr:hypothetical protein I4U23_005439 [Adineta vaga]